MHCHLRFFITSKSEDPNRGIYLRISSKGLQRQLHELNHSKKYTIKPWDKLQNLFP